MKKNRSPIFFFSSLPPPLPVAANPTFLRKSQAFHSVASGPAPQTLMPQCQTPTDHSLVITITAPSGASSPLSSVFFFFTVFLKLPPSNLQLGSPGSNLQFQPPRLQPSSPPTAHRRPADPVSGPGPLYLRRHPMYPDIHTVSVRRHLRLKLSSLPRVRRSRNRTGESGSSLLLASHDIT